MRLFWRILAAFGGLLVLLIIAVAIAVRTIDVNDFIAPMQKRVKDATGRDLVIRGGIDFKLSLEPELIIDDVTLGNAEWGKSPQMLTAKRVEAQVKLLPLLQRRFEIVRFKLVDPVISLETDAAGKGNWEFSNARDVGGAPQSPPGGVNAFAIGDLAIDHGTASFRDGESGKTTNIVIDELSLHSRNAESPVSARFRGSVGNLAVAMEGDLGPLQALAQRRWPYPVSLKGEVNGQAASIATKLRVEGKTVNLDELQIGTGTSKIDGQVALTPGAPRTRATFKLVAATLAWSDLPFARKLADASKGAAAREKFVFSDQPLDFAALQAFDADGDVSIGRLLLPEGRHVDNVRIQFTVRSGKLDAPTLQASAFGGTARGRLSIDAAHAPSLTLHLDAKALDAGALLEILAVKREVRGGKTDVTVDIAAHGESAHQWVQSANGSVTVVVGAATLVHTKLDLDSPLNRLADAVNPFHRVDPSTELECAVGRLPLKDGIAQIDRSIGLETKKFGASVSGTLNFRDETLDLAIKPQVRHGIPIDVPQVASLVRFQGPFRSPSVLIDAAGSAAAAAKIGAAIYTGGLSIVGESLFSAATGNNAGPCRIALGQGSAAPAPPAPSGPSSGATTPNPIGKAVGRILGR
jgi:AsmA family protein